MSFVPRLNLLDGISPTLPSYDPDAQQLAEITQLAASEVTRFGIIPKVALVSHSNFGSTDNPSAIKLRESLRLIQTHMPELECDGEMQSDAALIEEIRNRLYPKSLLKSEANLLIMPSLDAANITFNALKALAGGVSVGPILLGMRKSIHISNRVITTRGVVNLSTLAAVDAQVYAAFNYEASFGTPNWQVSCGFCAANPRDPFMVVGNEIIETPMADRGRYFETWAYRELFKEYFKAGAKWTSAPKPQLLDDLYDWNYTVPSADEPMRFMVTEFEPVFDAADVVRCGRDIFAQRSHVTNALGIEGLRRHLGDEYQVHEIHNLSPEAIHIDTTFMPLAPGKVLVSPEYVDINKLPPILNSWDILVAPEPVPSQDLLGVLSKWICINVLMLDEERVIVEKCQEPLIKALKNWGFKPIPCTFENYFPFLGSFHCATLDIRRRGELKSYF